MATAFPDGLGLCVGTALEDEDGVKIDITDDGAPALRQMYPQTYYVIDAAWTALTRELHATLRNFLSTNRLNELTLVVDDASYTVRQVSPLKTPYRYGGGKVDASCRFRGTKNGA